MATTFLKGVLTPGTLRDVNQQSATLEPFPENISDLPRSFGGTSGGGLWRVYVRRHGDDKYEAVHHRLIGIASTEDRQNVPPRWIKCQGPGRIEMMLEGVRRRMNGVN